MAPSIICIGVIGKHVCSSLQSANTQAHCCQNNPLHISLFAPEERALEFQFLLSSSLDIFEARLPHKTADQDFGLLQAVDERLAMYGWLTNTAVKFVIVVDMEGRPATASDSKTTAAVGLRDADMKPVSALEAIVSHQLTPIGVPGTPNGVHYAFKEPFLQPRRAFSNHSKCRAENRLNPDHKSEVHPRDQEDCGCVGSRRH
jgi:hypothetical protein